MSQIIATTLSNGSVSVPTATVVNGSAKAWVNFNGTGTIAARDSFNVSSLVDNGTGLYSVNFTNAFDNANFCVSGSCGPANTGGETLGTYVYVTTSVNVVTSDWTGAAVDRTFNGVSVDGDLA